MRAWWGIMKILLIQPTLDRTNNAADLKALDDNDNTLISIGLYSIAALLLDNGYDVSLINQTTTPWDESINEIQSLKPDLIGITCLSHNRHAIMQLVDTLKQMMPATKIALGGIHATSLYNLILRKHTSVDYIAIGEAETSFMELVQRLEEGKSTSGIKGIVQRKDGVNYSEKSDLLPAGSDGGSFADFDWIGHANPIMNLGRLSIPAKYFKYSVVSTARGCPFNCAFCSSPQIWGRSVRNRPIGHVMEELDLLKNKQGVDVIYFKDETFTMNKRRVIELCKAMIDAKLDIVWTCDTRTDCLNKEILYWMRKAGCYYVSVGIESGSEAMLKVIDKKTNIDKIKKGAAMVRESGILMRFYIIANLPGETTEDRQASINIIDACKPHYVSISLLQLSPCTKLYRQYCEQNKRDDNIWFEDKRLWIPYSEKCGWKDTEVGLKLMSYHLEYHDKQLFPYTENELREIQKKYSDCFGPNWELAVHLYTNKKFADAIPYLEISLNMWPDYRKGQIALGICLLNVSRAQEASDIFLNLRNKSGNNVLVWLMSGNAYLALGKYSRADRCYKKVLELQPDNVEAFNKLAGSLESQGKHKDALDIYRKLLRISPGNPLAVNNMARVIMTLREQALSKKQIH
jgi:radical SAM superfamily enzyme YgiQ (UPF0313 family)